MSSNEETLVFSSNNGALEDARTNGSLLEEDDASSAEEKKEVMTPDDSSVPLAKSSFDDDDEVSYADNNTTVVNSDSKEDYTDDGEPYPKWSDVLCTPSSAAVFTPAADINSLKQNMHGWALKNAYDRTKVLSRSGKNCSQLLSDIATLNDELSNAMLKLRPTLDSAASGTPLDDFSTDINACFLSFVKQTNDLAACTQNDIVRPFSEYSAALVDEGAQVYSRYSESRQRCFQARNNAVKMRQRCEASVKDAEGAAHALRNARRKSNGDNVTTSAVVLPQSVEDGEVELSLEETLKRFGSTHGLVKNCEAVASALADIEASEMKYVDLVEAENVAVADAQDIERQALDAAQQNEEKRLLYMIGALERFLQMTRQAMDKMALDITAEPLELNMDSSNPRDSPPPTSAPKIFKSPRRLRTTSDDTGPSINETKLLNLPDELADLRDTMKSLIGRQSARLKALKLISTFNEGISTALENFAANIQTRLESDGFIGNKSDGKKSGPLAAHLKKNEGEVMLSAWVIVIKTLKDTVQLARDASKQVKGGNSQLYNILLQADKEIKALKDGDELRWKYLNDAAKGETKAKLKHSQLSIDLQKAKARLSTLEDDNAAGSVNGPKNNAANKAMGKMFSILPGGGEHVMNQMLTPQQRQAVVMEQLKEAETKEAKAAEAAATAKSVKEQAIASYSAEAEASISKNESDERRTWELMQESLLCAVDAINRFRHGQVEVFSNSLSEMQTHSKIVVSNDVSHWTHTAEKRIKDKRSRFVTEDLSGSVDDADSGFSLKVKRIDSTELRKLIERVLSDSNIDDSIESTESTQIGPTPATEEVAGESAPKSKLPDVPKDPIIGKMDPIFTKKLKGVSIETYYEKGWSDKINPLYSPWLERKGSFDVLVSEWEHSDEGFENKWSGERFHQRRTVKFKFKRTTHLYIGPPVAGVTQTQYCFRDGDDKCVIMMTVEMDGIPYSDVFAVEVRWAARRVGANDIFIDAGVFVNFIKSSMFASKIKSGTLIETKPIHLDLFEEIKKVLKSDDNATALADAGDVEEEEEDEISTEVVAQEVVTVQTPTDSPWSRFSGMVMSLPKPAKVLALGMTSFIVMRLLFRKPDPTVAELSRQVEDLGTELKEIKAMLANVLEAVGEGKCNST